MTEPELVDLLAERHVHRMSHPGVAWADLSPELQDASRAIVAPILADLRAIAGGCGDE